MSTPFGDRLRAARKAKGWSMNRLAEECGVHVQTLRDYEIENRYPRYQVLEAICSALGLPPCRLMGSPCDKDHLRIELSELQSRLSRLRSDMTEFGHRLA